MILISNKDFNSLSETTVTRLTEAGFTTTPGGIAKLFADILNQNISDFYETLTINHMQAFVTTATGEFLDAVGVLLNCTRKTDETDEDYRNRVTHQVLSLSMANETAIRLVVLQVDGVEDVILKRYSHGPGSFTVVPLINSSYDVATVLEAVEAAVLKVCSYGEKVIVKAPTIKYVKMTVSLVFSINTTDVEKQNTAVAVRENIIDYINSLSAGAPFLVNELTQRIMNQAASITSGTYDYSKDNIINYSCADFKINNQTCLLINQGARWDEKFAVSPDTNAITVV
jgi:uncharacterized phage protein gp47/JayE